MNGSDDEMEIRHFITFRKVVEYGSFTNAAKHLGYTQSTITSHIQALEQHLGMPLIERIGRSIKLTDTGRKVLDYSKELLNTYEKIESIPINGDIVSGEIKIAAPESLTVYRLEPILREYREKYPDVRIILTNATCGDNRRSLLNGRADIAFLMWPELDDFDLVGHTLQEEQIVLVGNQRCVLEEIGGNNDNQKLSECLITNEKECSYRTVLEEYLRARRIIPSYTMELWSIEAIKRCVISGLGVAYLPLMTVSEEIDEEKLKIIPCVGNFKKIYSQMAYHKNKWLTPALDEFITITLNHGKGWGQAKIM